MKYDLVLRHVDYYDGKTIQKDKIICIQKGLIAKIVEENDIERKRVEADIEKDCRGVFAYPAFLDAHLHFPGKFLYAMYGMDLTGAADLEGYADRIRVYKENTTQAVHKGFGFSMGVLEKQDGTEQLKNILNEVFTEEPAILFSDDFHHAVCNDSMRQLLEKKYPEIHVLGQNRIAMENIFKLFQIVDEITFTEKEIEEAILAFQELLLSCGIAAVQTLLFLGGNGKKEYEVLKKMDQAHKLKLKICFACTVYPYETLSEIEKKYRELQQFNSEHLKLQALKLYLDGVVDNESAFLLDHYEKTETSGECYWNRDKLQQVCNFADQKKIPLHMHAIGDGAVHVGVEALKQAMDSNSTIGQTKHVMAHLQLAEAEDIRIMGQYGIIACVQPYWISEGNDYYIVDCEKLGRRVKEEYKLHTFLNNDVLVTGSSDSPVVGKPIAFTAMKKVFLRENNREKVSIEELFNMFTINAALQLGLENEYGSIAVGKKAAILFFNQEANENNICADELQIVSRV